MKTFLKLDFDVEDLIRINIATKYTTLDADKIIHRLHYKREEGSRQLQDILRCMGPELQRINIFSRGN